MWASWWRGRWSGFARPPSGVSPTRMGGAEEAFAARAPRWGGSHLLQCFHGSVWNLTEMALRGLELNLSGDEGMS